MSTRYYFNERGTFVHVVRTMTHHKWRDEYSHTGVHFRCGNLGFLSKERRAKVYAVAPAGHPLCQKCVLANQLAQSKVKENSKMPDESSDGRVKKTVTVTLSNLTEFRISFPFPATPAEHAEFIAKLRDLKTGMAPPVKKTKSKAAS